MRPAAWRFVIRELLDAGLLHGDVTTVAGQGGLRALSRRSRCSTAAG